MSRQSLSAEQPLFSHPQKRQRPGSNAVSGDVRKCNNNMQQAFTSTDEAKEELRRRRLKKLKKRQRLEQRQSESGKGGAIVEKKRAAGDAKSSAAADNKNFEAKSTDSSNTDSEYQRLERRRLLKNQRRLEREQQLQEPKPPTLLNNITDARFVNCKSLGKGDEEESPAELLRRRRENLEKLIAKRRQQQAESCTSTEAKEAVVGDGSGDTRLISGESEIPGHTKPSSATSAGSKPAQQQQKSSDKSAPDSGSKNLSSQQLKVERASRVGARLCIYWKEEHQFFPGKVERIVPSKTKGWFVRYDDGDEEWVNLHEERFMLLKEKPSGESRYHDAFDAVPPSTETRKPSPQAATDDIKSDAASKKAEKQPTNRFEEMVAAIKTSESRPVGVTKKAAPNAAEKRTKEEPPAVPKAVQKQPPAPAEKSSQQACSPQKEANSSSNAPPRDEDEIARRLERKRLKKLKKKKMQLLLLKKQQAVEIGADVEPLDSSSLTSEAKSLDSSSKQDRGRQATTTLTEDSTAKSSVLSASGSASSSELKRLKKKKKRKDLPVTSAAAGQTEPLSSQAITEERLDETDKMIVAQVADSGKQTEAKDKSRDIGGDQERTKQHGNTSSAMPAPAAGREAAASEVGERMGADIRPDGFTRHPKLAIKKRPRAEDQTAGKEQPVIRIKKRPKKLSRQPIVVTESTALATNPITPAAPPAAAFTAPTPARVTDLDDSSFCAQTSTGSVTTLSSLPSIAAALQQQHQPPPPLPALVVKHDVVVDQKQTIRRQKLAVLTEARKQQKAGTKKAVSSDLVNENSNYVYKSEWVANGCIARDDSDSDTDDEELWQWAAMVFPGVSVRSSPSRRRRHLRRQHNNAANRTEDPMRARPAPSRSSSVSCSDTHNVRLPRVPPFESGQAEGLPQPSASAGCLLKYSQRDKPTQSFPPRNAAPASKQTRWTYASSSDEESDDEWMEAQAKKECSKRDAERALTAAEVESILKDEDDDDADYYDDEDSDDSDFGNCTRHPSKQQCSAWVRRSIRLPGAAALQSPNFKVLMAQLESNFNPDVVVLKLKKYIPDPNCPQLVMDAVLDALERNTNCQSLYIQNFNEGMRDKQMLHLLKILQQPSCNIWCLNIGETYKVKSRTWKLFAAGLRATKITHMYASEHTITPALKDQIRTTIRNNRAKHDMHIDPQNLDVIIRCTHCWWNPINAKKLRPYIQRKGYDETLLQNVELQGLRGSTSGADLL